MFLKIAPPFIIDEAEMEKRADSADISVLFLDALASLAFKLSVTE